MFQVADKEVSLTQSETTAKKEQTRMMEPEETYRRWEKVSRQKLVKNDKR